MKNKKAYLLLSIIIFMVFFLAALTRSGVMPVVVKAPQSMAAQPLSALWDWAVAESRSLADGFWIGYSISKKMSRNSRIGHFGSDRESLPTLNEILSGEAAVPTMPAEMSDKDAARKALKRSAGRKESDEMVTKEVGILFRFDGNPAEMRAIQEIEIGNLSSPVDLEEKPLVWLGNIGQEESARFLGDAYDTGISPDIREEFTALFGIHTESASAAASLKKIIGSEEPVDVREKAVFWLGQHNNLDALEFLKASLLKESLGELKKKIVFSISQIRIEEALTALVDAARKSNDPAVRKQAIFWLGQKAASAQALSVLSGIAEDDPDREIKEQAIFALSRLPDNTGIPVLIEIAKNNASSELRKKAIFWLSQSDDSRARDAIIELVAGR